MIYPSMYFKPASKSRFERLWNKVTIIENYGKSNIYLLDNLKILVGFALYDEDEKLYKYFLRGDIYHVQ